MFIHRVLGSGVPLSRRWFQLSNTMTEALLGERMKLAHVVEYPKCGGSWVRNMVRTYRGAKRLEDDRFVASGDVLMSHQLYRPWIANPIVVVRDPRDVFVSFYYYETSYSNKNENSPLFRRFTPDESRSPQDDFSAYLEAKLSCQSNPWFSFGEFLDSWLDRPQTCLVRYEDCLSRTESELARILRFLGDEIDPRRLGLTIQETSFEAITKTKYGQARRPGKADNTKFHRKGVAGDWRSLFSAASCRLLERHEGRSLRHLGYVGGSSWIDEFLTR